MLEASCDFSGDPENVRAARRFVSETAESWGLGDLAWPLVQIVSELASNAIIHAGTGFVVRLVHDGESTRIEVLDGSVRRAQPRRYELDATTGRGLRLVHNLSREWGALGSSKGKTVWAVVDSGSLLDTDAEDLAESFLGALDGDDVAEPPTNLKQGRHRRGGSDNELLAA
ncbi:MAG TPA: ATP-binding protein [Mycobacteriales bacterium]|nr:ATP-binding protein [Mycobacteriales bacterium]